MHCVLFFAALVTSSHKNGEEYFSLSLVLTLTYSKATIATVSSSLVPLFSDDRHQHSRFHQTLHDCAAVQAT